MADTDIMTQYRRLHACTRVNSEGHSRGIRGDHHCFHERAIRGLISCAPRAAVRGIWHGKNNAFVRAQKRKLTRKKRELTFECVTGAPLQSLRSLACFYIEPNAAVLDVLCGQIRNKFLDLNGWIPGRI